jgi:hypothetical protein
MIYEEHQIFWRIDRREGNHFGREYNRETRKVYPGALILMTGWHLKNILSELRDFKAGYFSFTVAR